MTKVITYAHTETGKIQGDVLVCDGGELTLTGMISGTLTVATGGYAHVTGLVGQLVVRDAGSARLDGMCTGDVHNLGGELTVHGMVNGSTYGFVTTV